MQNKKWLQKGMIKLLNKDMQLLKADMQVYKIEKLK
jgi:hypothetical protein